MRTLIEHAWILTMDEEMREFYDGQIVIEDERIVYVGEAKQQEHIDEIINAKNQFVLPGMINTHSHVAMIPFRSLGDDCKDRLRRFLFPLENACVNEKLVYSASCYGIAEMLCSGITTFADMYYFMDEVAKACEFLGIRAVLGETIIDQETCDAKNAKEALNLAENFMKEWYEHPLITPMIAPHATNTNCKENFIEALRLARKYKTLMMTHVAEMDYEMRYFQETYQMTPIQWLASIDCLDEHVLAVHCIHIDEGDIALLKKHNAKVSHCPVSNVKAGKGIAPIKSLVEHNVPVGFGSDGPSSGNTLDLFTQMRMFACLQKTKYHDRSLFPAKEIVRLATIEGARVLGMQEEIGSLEVGKKADIIFVSLDAIHMFPVHDPYSVLVYSANANDVSNVFVNGKHIVKNKQLHKDILEVKHRLQEQMKEFNEKAMELIKQS